MREKTIGGIIDALRAQVQQQRDRWPPGDWITPLEVLMRNGDSFAKAALVASFPMVAFKESGVVELANDCLLKECCLSTEDIASGKISIMATEYIALGDAVLMAYMDRIAIANGLVHPLYTFCRSGNVADPADYLSALVFPYIGDNAAIKGIAVFLPHEIAENED